MSIKSNQHIYKSAIFAAGLLAATACGAWHVSSSGYHGGGRYYHGGGYHNGGTYYRNGGGYYRGGGGYYRSGYYGGRYGNGWGWGGTGIAIGLPIAAAAASYYAPRCKNVTFCNRYGRHCWSERRCY